RKWTRVCRSFLVGFLFEKTGRKQDSAVGGRFVRRFSEARGFRDDDNLLRGGAFKRGVEIEKRGLGRRPATDDGVALLLEVAPIGEKIFRPVPILERCQ